MKVQQIPFYFIVVVWGDAYVEMLLKVSLRCFLSPQNIPALNNLMVSKFIFATTKVDYLKISQSAIFKRLEKYIEPMFLEIDAPVADDNVYTRMTLGYELATAVACKNKACAIYLSPDCLVSDGTFLSLERYAQQGREVVLTPGPRLVKEKVMFYVDGLQLDEGEPFTFAPRKLAALGLEFSHTQFMNYNYNFAKQGFTKWPQLVTWRIPEQRGFLIRSFHLHPLMVAYTNYDSDVSFNKFDTIDGDFIKRNFRNLNQFLIETDSDNIQLYSMTEEADRVEERLLWSEKQKIDAILEISQNGVVVNELHKIYFYYAYKLHPDDLTAEWLAVERESLAVVNAVLMPNVTLVAIFKKLRRVILDRLPAGLKTQLKPIFMFTYKPIRDVMRWCSRRLTKSY